MNIEMEHNKFKHLIFGGFSECMMSFEYFEGALDDSPNSVSWFLTWKMGFGVNVIWNTEYLGEKRVSELHKFSIE